MALQVWLPLISDVSNNGLSDLTATIMGSGITYNAGKIGNAAKFPNDPANCIHMPGLAQKKNFSWAFWYKCLGEGASPYQFILSEGRDYGIYGINVFLSKNGKTLYAKIGGDGTAVQHGVTVELNKWYHVAFVVGEDTTKLYLNGVLISEKGYAEPDYTYSADRFVIGKMAFSYSATTNYFPFNGLVNDARIYDHALSVKEVKEISKAMVLHYTLDETGTIDTTVYDSSGFCNNGIATNITVESDTPRYSSCSAFNGSSSYIMVSDNDWMTKYAEEMTINVWAYAANWASQTNSRLFSCTEGGGFNTEGGNSGYLRFPIYVATNETQTSYAYRYDSQEIKISDLAEGWHMFTFVYTTSEHRTYIDGEPHHTYADVSYGIRFNTDARLHLGCEATGGGGHTSPYFNGRESDFRLYYTALSDDDIKALYERPASADRNGSLYTYEYVEVSS